MVRDFLHLFSAHLQSLCLRFHTLFHTRPPPQLQGGGLNPATTEAELWYGQTAGDRESPACLRLSWGSAAASEGPMLRLPS